jgi:hypothetical protein
MHAVAKKENYESLRDEKIKSSKSKLLLAEHGILAK